MKITIIGTASYHEKMEEHQRALEEQGHEVALPAFDNFAGMNELQVCEFNRDKIEWADEVHIIWDARSIGTIFDFGMCFALRKIVKLVYLNDKTFSNLIRQWEESKNPCVFRQ